MKRLFDIVSAAGVLIVFAPLLIFISIWIIIDSGFPIFYKQQRIGKNLKPFGLFKFRTMVTNAEKQGKITVGRRDPRVTKVGYYLRKYKLDELPQLINILIGDMSVVGPRPEVQEYVKLYNKEQLKVLSVKPGLTDYASLAYINENEVLEKSSNPQKTYIEEIMPEKLALNQKYIQEKSFFTDLNIIIKTLLKIIA